MEMIKLVLIFLLLLTNIFCREMDADNWNEKTEEMKWPDVGFIEDVLVRLTRKPGPRQYFGLMGKKDTGKAQRARKRHKFQTFVGLMGKRSFEDQGTTFTTED
ncbi:protachykinin-like [Salarias fasciatus]|uniref:protachykinin-like n=1 Tax=Salarias fasciatus TaxID=181472 RepID=UPI001176A316|nr:protachykinin-1 [Salarias fasciatus]